ncbi:olfactory receptor 10V1-like [Heteronotia binoei]|uniref:olfactory receptor 10V1-like n=1 Tax=Heteronotia binoei TaxID=13085 RepID=UPI0029303326|nr:olfactory receptor 10V1-like [Heteronotia binoei]
MESLDTETVACLYSMIEVLVLCLHTARQLINAHVNRSRKRRRNFRSLVSSSVSDSGLGLHGMCTRCNMLHWHYLAGLRFSLNYWVYPRSVGWWENYVLAVWSDEQWITHFRMSRGTFLEIYSIVKDKMDRQTTRMRSPVHSEKQLAAGIWYLANGITYRLVSVQFGIGVSTVHGIVMEVCEALESRLFSKVIRLGDEIGKIESAMATTMNQKPMFISAFFTDLGRLLGAPSDIHNVKEGCISHSLPKDCGRYERTPQPGQTAIANVYVKHRSYIPVYMALENENQTGMTQFHFHPFSTLPEIQLLIFWTFLILFLLSLLGNSAVVFTVCTERSLHNPMYFFLANLAVLEIAYSFVIAPLTLVNLASVKKASISLVGCGMQMFFFIFLGGADCVLLSVMAYDRYVAICYPLRYPAIMNWTVCVSLVAGTFTISFLFGIQLSVLILQLPFCGNNEINHFFCDFPAVLRLVCSETHAYQVTLFIISVVILTIPFLLVCISYAFIVTAILHIHSTEGRKRAFSTCSSHLMVVLLQYSCGSLIYLRPSSSYSPEEGRVVAVVYTFITPVLNPLIYSMRNKELKNALKRILRRKVFFQ